ncbi:MAG: molybdopterin-dependent oxidoreductase [Candidatus Bathyarchaeota archaeon]|nr:molybdopterin-dependent oxidoreductase [Candidatus Bathyarchaeota archaeon]
MGETTPFLKVTNTDGTTITLPPDYLLTLPKTTVYAELYCYGNLVTDGYWGGVKLTDLISQAGGLDENVDSIYFEAQDGYKVHIPIKTAVREDVLVAYEKDGAPLPEGLRLVIPNANGNLWIALITSMTMSTLQIPEGRSSGTDSSPLSIPFTPSQQASTQPQPQVQPTPTMQPDNNINTTPVNPSVNITQQEPLTDNDITKQADSGVSWRFSVELSSAIFASILIALTVMFVVLQRRTRTSLKGT